MIALIKPTSIHPSTTPSISWSLCLEEKPALIPCPEANRARLGPSIYRSEGCSIKQAHDKESSCIWFECYKTLKLCLQRKILSLKVFIKTVVYEIWWALKICLFFILLIENLYHCYSRSVGYPKNTKIWERYSSHFKSNVCALNFLIH